MEEIGKQMRNSSPHGETGEHTYHD